MPPQKIQPEFLKRGDEVMIVSPSFCIDEKKLKDAVPFLEKWGLKVRIGKNAASKKGPFAGSDEERLSDLQEAINNPAVRAILCARGGYGMSRIISRIDLSPLRRDPKWFAGFSDITVLHIWLSEVAGIMSVHGEMPLHYGDPEKSAASFTTLRKALFGQKYSVKWNGEFFRPKDVSGEITGGNLSLLWSLTGTRGEPVTKGKILFIEEVGEYYYRLDRMLISLKLAGKLDGLSALVVGGMNKMEDIRVPWGKSIGQTIMDIVDDYDYPVFTGFPAGHVDDNRAFYIGRNAIIKVKNKSAELEFA